MKISRRSVLNFVVPCAVVSAAAACGSKTRTTGAAEIGGPFQLTDSSGRRVSERLLRGKWTAIFFGYTSCPDVCPTTLTALGQAVAALGGKARDLQVVFVTVDPDRDTPAQLARYLSAASFPKGTIGLTGSAAQIAAVARAYRVYYKRIPDGATYSMDHTAVIYLMDPEGRFNCPVNSSQTPPQIADQIAKAMTAG